MGSGLTVVLRQRPILTHAVCSAACSQGKSRFRGGRYLPEALMAFDGHKRAKVRRSGRGSIESRSSVAEGTHG